MASSIATTASFAVFGSFSRICDRDRRVVAERGAEIAVRDAAEKRLVLDQQRLIEAELSAGA